MTTVSRVIGSVACLAIGFLALRYARSDDAVTRSADSHIRFWNRIGGKRGELAEDYSPTFRAIGYISSGDTGRGAESGGPHQELVRQHNEL